tara:strand:- start:3715 stop:4866 length:1152 start_codon:yes stop_codon:yes gene_type:complete
MKRLILLFIIFSSNISYGQKSTTNVFDMNADNEYYSRLSLQKANWYEVSGEINATEIDGNKVNVIISSQGSFSNRIQLIKDDENNLLKEVGIWRRSSYSGKIDEIFDSKIAQFFELFGEYEDNFVNERVDNIMFENGYSWRTYYNKQPARVTAGYAILENEIKNRKGKVKRIEKVRVGIEIYEPIGDVLSVEEIDMRSSVASAIKVGEGFLDSYRNSNIKSYVTPYQRFAFETNDYWEKNKKEISQIYFSSEDDDSPKSFLETLQLLGLSFYDIDVTDFENVGFTFSTLEPGIIAAAEFMDNNCMANIIIDIEKWNDSNYYEKLFIMMHELGHDIFNLRHSDGLRLMATNEYKLSSPEELGEIIHEMFYFIKTSLSEASYLCK